MDLECNHFLLSRDPAWFSGKMPWVRAAQYPLDFSWECPSARHFADPRPSTGETQESHE